MLKFRLIQKNSVGLPLLKHLTSVAGTASTTEGQPLNGSTKYTSCVISTWYLVLTTLLVSTTPTHSLVAVFVLVMTILNTSSQALAAWRALVPNSDSHSARC